MSILFLRGPSRATRKCCRSIIRGEGTEFNITMIEITTRINGPEPHADDFMPPRKMSSRMRTPSYNIDLTAGRFGAFQLLAISSTRPLFVAMLLGISRSRRLEGRAF